MGLLAWASACLNGKAEDFETRLREALRVCVSCDKMPGNVNTDEVMLAVSLA